MCHKFSFHIFFGGGALIYILYTALAKDERKLKLFFFLLSTEQNLLGKYLYVHIVISVQRKTKIVDLPLNELSNILTLSSPPGAIRVARRWGVLMQFWLL